MDEFVKDHLEQYLSGSASRDLKHEIETRLSADASAAKQVGQMRMLGQSLKSLKAEGVEPTPGFYARVMDRIEAQGTSVWYSFLESGFAQRLALASFALVLLMGGWMISNEPGDELTLSVPETIDLLGEDGPAPVLGDIRPRNRDAVLVNLASYQEQ
ncbi:MAG: hypothetical protein K2X35_05945 [Bryobacteraceae bacterium]|nr:hypothetical protein [Bryobacteraceae bacterium]